MHRFYEGLANSNFDNSINIEKFFHQNQKQTIQVKNVSDRD